MENKGGYLNEIPASGEITILAAVVEKEIRPKRNGGSYLALRLAHRSGELGAKVWDNPEAVSYYSRLRMLSRSAAPSNTTTKAAAHHRPSSPL